VWREGTSESIELSGSDVVEEGLGIRALHLRNIVCSCTEWGGGAKKKMRVCTCKMVLLFLSTGARICWRELKFQCWRTRVFFVLFFFNGKNTKCHIRVVVAAYSSF
jgi:hypothetical protein